MAAPASDSQQGLGSWVRGRDGVVRRGKEGRGDEIRGVKQKENAMRNWRTEVQRRGRLKSEGAAVSVTRLRLSLFCPVSVFTERLPAARSLM